MPEPPKTPNNNPEVALDQPTTREISQIDHINKKLLASLFKRMDEEADASQPEETAADDDEWKD